MRNGSNNINGRLFIGAVLIIMGLLFFMRNFHFLVFNFDLFSWPVIFFILGILVIVKNRNSSFGFILLAIGGLGIISRYFDMPIRYFITEYWPFLLIIFGIYVIFKRSSHHETGQYETVDTEEYKIDSFTLLSSKNLTIKTNNFLGGKITSILGESVVDLRNSNLAGSKIELETQTILGSIEIHIPSSWNIINKTTTILGGFEDVRGISTNSENNQNTLIISGLVLLGGGKIKD